MRHSWLGFPRLLGALVIVLGLAAPAQAVDWSAYIDRSAPARAQPTTPAKTSRTKVSKRSNKKVAKAKAKRGKVKARAKAKSKKARRR